MARSSETFALLGAPPAFEQPLHVGRPNIGNRDTLLRRVERMLDDARLTNDGPLVMDTPFGSTMNHFQNNLEGPLPMTPEWMIKVAGSYTIPRIETDFGLRYRYDSGRAFLK